MSILTFKELKNGKLRISYLKGHKKELREYHNEHGEIDTMMEETESYWTNGWGVFTGDQLGQLTEAPIIAKESYFEEDSSHTLNGPAWWYPDYQVTDFIEVILDKGFIDFDLWEKMDMVNFPSPYNRS